jgi:hypothetical protein
MRWVLLLITGCVALGAQTPKIRAWVAARPAIWEGKDATYFEAAEAIRVPLLRSKNDRSSTQDRNPGAVVEIWGDASWARQDQFKAFVRANLASFRDAFDAGLGSSIGGQMLAELMNHPEDLHKNPAPAMAPRVWYNAQDPWARDRRFFK